MRDSDDNLLGDTVTEVREATKWDLVLEFESGRVLHVYDAKWRISQEDSDDAE